MDSSGQSIKHYATSCHTILLSPTRNILLDDLPIKEDIAIIDIGETCCNLKGNVKYYDNLSYNSDVDEMMVNFYSKLRDFELYYLNDDIKVLYLVNNKKEETIISKIHKYNSLYDRMYRSASGNNLLI